MHEKITEINKKFKTLIRNKLFSIPNVAKLNNMGVYIIYDESKVIYIGSTNRFKIRLGNDLKHTSTHTLVKKLLKNSDFSNTNDVSNYLFNKCIIKYIECSSKREAEALEHIAIYILNPKYNK